MAEIDLGYLGACGIYCKRCDIHLAGVTGDRASQEKIARWIEANCDAQCGPDQIHCGGCWGPDDEHWSADCRVLICARKRGVRLCTDCSDYEGCETLKQFYDGGDYETARKTLERIREVGLEAWVGEQAGT